MSKRLKRTIFIIAFVLLFLGVAIAVLLNQLSKSVGNNEVADYETRINIWSTVAGNSTQSKLEGMNIDYNQTNTFSATIKFADAIEIGRASCRERVYALV